MMNKKVYLPQFPLSLVAFPGEKLNLHVFEPRYKELVKHCTDHQENFGIPPYHENKLIYFGTEMKITEISKIYEDGRMDIKTEGVNVYQIHKFDKIAPNKLYSGASVSIMKDEFFYNPDLEDEILKLIERLFELLEINKPVSRFKEQFNSYSIAHHAGLDMDEKIKLLTMRSENQRLQFIKSHLKAFIPKLNTAEELKERAALNGHFKNLSSPDF